MGSKTKTDFLFASPSFASGAGRLLDLYGQFDQYNGSDSAVEADQRALYSDWRIVGEEIQKALDEFETLSSAA